MTNHPLADDDGLLLGIDRARIKLLFRIAEFERHRSCLAEWYRAVEAGAAARVARARALLIHP